MLLEYVNQLAKSLFLVVSTYLTNELILNGDSEKTRTTELNWSEVLLPLTKVGG